VQDEIGTILELKDIEELKLTDAFSKFEGYLLIELRKARIDADTVKPDRLLFLQGRIDTLKHIINLFEDET
jgi:hypothetical protein